jgi:hypothetical protein
LFFTSESKGTNMAGTLNARLLPNGTVETSFSPKEGVAMRPMLAKNLDTAQWDLVRTYRLTPAEAAAFRARIERQGSASIPTAL